MDDHKENMAETRGETISQDSQRQEHEFGNDNDPVLTAIENLLTSSGDQQQAATVIQGWLGDRKETSTMATLPPHERFTLTGTLGKALEVLGRNGDYLVEDSLSVYPANEFSQFLLLPDIALTAPTILQLQITTGEGTLLVLSTPVLRHGRTWELDSSNPVQYNVHSTASYYCGFSKPS